ncbi:MAG: S-layer homology domain-containing protein, partial [Oscillospiraceae bacterium]
GVSDGTNPTGNVTREQLVTMLWRYSGSPTATADLSKFTDADSVSAYAKQAMAWAVEKGIVSGTTATTLSPKSNAARAELASIMMRYTK